MVEVEGLGLETGRKKILKDVSFTLHEGEIVVLLGSNGSGKTSLIRCLSSYYNRYSGCIKYGGKDLKEYPMEKRASLHSLLPQIVPSVDMSLLQLLFYAAESSGLNRKKAKKRVEEVLMLSGMESFSNTLVSRMSGGERQLAFLSFMAVRDSKAYYLDEPEASLDAKFKNRAKTIIEKIRQQGRIVLLSMHDMNRALMLADRILVLYEGRLAFNGSPSAFLDGNLGERYFSLELRSLQDENGKKIQLYL